MEKVLVEFNKKNKREKTKKGIPKKITQILSSLPACTLAILLASTNPAYSQDLQNSNSEFYSSEEQEAMRLLRLRLQAQIDGVFMQGSKYWHLINNANLEIADTQIFKDFMVDFIGVLDVLDTNNALNGFDINAGVVLWLARGENGVSSDEYLHAYEEFIGPYTNPDLNIVELLERNGFPYHGGT